MRIVFRKFGIVRRVAIGIVAAGAPWLVLLGIGAARYYVQPLRDPAYYDGKCPGWGDYIEKCSLEKWQRWNPSRSGPQIIDGMFLIFGLVSFSFCAVVGSLVPVSWPTLKRDDQLVREEPNEGI